MNPIEPPRRFDGVPLNPLELSPPLDLHFSQLGLIFLFV